MGRSYSRNIDGVMRCNIMDLMPDAEAVANLCSHYLMSIKWMFHHGDNSTQFLWSCFRLLQCRTIAKSMSCVFIIVQWLRTRQHLTVVHKKNCELHVSATHMTCFQWHTGFEQSAKIGCWGPYKNVLHALNSVGYSISKPEADFDWSRL